MRRRLLGSAFALFSAAVLVSCTETPISSLNNPNVPAPQASLVAGANVVISQIYGAGGNSGATYNADYVELFNRGDATATITGLKLQYASAAGSSWSTVTLPAATIPAGRYYLVQLAGGTNGVPLPVTADFTNTGINMSGTAGKIVLTTNATTLSGTCPTVAGIVDKVGFGANNTAGGCTTEWGGRTADLSTANAAWRKNNGCVNNGNAALDFEVKAALPRNSATAQNDCPPAVSVTPATVSILPDATQQFTAQLTDGQGVVQSTTFTWSIVGDPAIATIDASGQVTGHSTGDVTVRATSATSVVGSAQLHVGARPVVTVTVTPGTASTFVNGTQQFSAVGLDNLGGTVPGTTFTWTSSSPSVTINASGLATAVSPGDATITAKSNNNVTGTAQMHVDVPAVITGDVVISQVYGGGGNGSATYTNDFVELFNRGTQAQDITGWKIVYTSAAGTFGTSNTTTLPAGSIAPGHYYLVQLASQAAVGVPLPTSDATGTTNMGGTAGKVVLAIPGAAPTGTCPTGGAIIDYVAYGSSSASGNCAVEWGGRTADVSSTTSAFRGTDGCVDTNSGSDWAVLNVNPRNSSTTGYKSCTPVSRAQSSATLVINEVMGDPAAALSASWGEWFEVYNYGSQAIDLQGWKIISGGSSQPDHTINTSVIVPAGGYAVIGRGNDPDKNGGVDLAYNYFTGNATTIWLDDSDYLMLVDNANARVDSVAWTSLPHGATRGVRDAAQDNANVGGANWGYATLTFGAGDYGTPGFANDPLTDVAPPVSATRLTFSGRTASDAAVPVGFEAQMFANEFDASNTAIFTNITWEAVTPAIATVDARGVLHGVSPGTAVFRATATDGTTRLNSVTIATAVASATAQYLNNTEFGDPVDQQARASYIVRRPQYTTSYNVDRGIPNWVAYEINATHIVAGQDRCNCFTFDPELPAEYPRYTTADYTGAGSFAGYGIDRGHMTRSFDRTAGTLDNAVTYYLDNVVPQAADLNQGPWANEENYLGDLAQNQNKEVYIYVGPAGSIGTVKGEGKITIPAYTWKVALILPRGKGLHDIANLSDVTAIATVMPNTPGVRNVDWNTYRVTVDSVEALTGFDLLAALPDNIEIALESNTHIPVAALNGPYSGDAHTAIAMSAAASSDADGDALTYSWSFGDGADATGVSTSHTYSRSGDFTVSVIVTDILGVADTATAVAHVADPTPAVIAPTVTGTLGSNGWYTGDVQVSWSVSDPESDIGSSTGCSAASVLVDTDGQLIKCSVVNGYGLPSADSVTIKRDASAPVVSYTGNLGTYTVADTTHITCSAADVGPSGLASTTCADVNVAAYTLALGMHAYSASATDNAGNVGNGSTSFTVTVSTSSLSQLVKTFEKNAGQQNAMLQQLAAAQASADRGNANAQAGQVGAFINLVEAQRGKTLTAAQADLLIRLARAL